MCLSKLFPPLQKQRRAPFIAAIVLGGLVFALVYRQFFWGMILKRPFPFNTFFFNPDDRFGDLRYVHGLFSAGIKPFSGYLPGNTALPLAMLLLAGLCAFPFWLSLAVFYALALFFTFWYVKSRMPGNAPRWTVLALAFCPYPVLFLLNRCNYELFVFIPLVLFMRAFQKEDYRCSALLLGLAAAVKPFCLVFIVLFVCRGKFRRAFQSLLWACAASVSAFLLLARLYSFAPSAALMIIVRAGAAYNLRYNAGVDGIFYAHSIFGALKLLLCHFYDPFLFRIASLNSIFLALQKPYLTLAAGIFAWLAWYCVKVETVFWKQVALLCACMLALPYNSPDYRLVHLLLPVMLFINSDVESASDRVYAWLFGLLLVPKHYCLMFFAMVPWDTGIGVLASPALLCALVWLIVKEGFAVRRGYLPVTKSELSQPPPWSR